MVRRGMGFGTGKGYKNIAGSDPRIHSQSAKGYKQPQHINIISPNALPIYKIGGQFYFRDARLGEYRNIADPSDRKRIDDVPNSKLQNPTKNDSEFLFGKEWETINYTNKFDNYNSEGDFIINESGEAHHIIHAKNSAEALEKYKEKYGVTSKIINIKKDDRLTLNDIRYLNFRNSGYSHEEAQAKLLVEEMSDPDKDQLKDIHSPKIDLDELKWREQKDRLNADVIKGLSSWVQDYKKAREFGNIKLAKQIRDNIVKILKENGINEPYNHEIWGEDPQKDQLKGGLGDNKPDSAFDKKELAKGIKVEMEHTTNPKIAKEVAKDHLTEFKGKPYYKELDKMENKLKKENKQISWNKIPNHNEWLNNSNQQLSVAYNLNGEHKGKYSLTIGDKPNSKGNRKVLLELNFKTQSSALKFANDYIKNKGVI
jgi:hypothetical protein